LTFSPPSRDEDSFCKTAMSRREDVLSCIYIAIMDRFAHAALPSPYSKIFPAFRAGAAVTHATGLGGKRFVDFPEPHACVSALVPKHGSKRTPTCIQNRFCMSGLGEGGCIHIADEDCTVASGQAGAQFVQKVFSAIDDLGVNRTSAGSLSRPLGAGQLWFQITVELLGINRRKFGVTEGREALQAQIDSNARHRVVKNCGNRKLRSLRPGDANIQIPASSAILIEATRPQLKVTETEAIPQGQPSSSEVHLAPAIMDRSHLERNPTQGPPCPSASTPGESDLAMLRSADRILLSNLLHRLNGQTQTAIPAGGAFEVWPKVESRQKPPLPLEHFDRQVIAIVEDEIDLTGQAREPCGVLILHPQTQHTNGT
jgi:hypothetical protein